MKSTLNSWEIVNDRVRLSYDVGDLYITLEDFNRAFGPIVSASYDDVKRDFAV